MSLAPYSKIQIIFKKIFYKRSPREIIKINAGSLGTELENFLSICACDVKEIS